MKNSPLVLITLALLAFTAACNGGDGKGDATDTPYEEIGDPAVDDVRLDEPSDTADVTPEELDMPPEDIMGEEALDVPVEPNPEWEGIACGFNTCYSPQICCFEYPYYYTDAECMDEADCGGYLKSCDGSEDCDAGETCCVANDSYPASVCQTEACTRKICHVDEECAEGQLCCPHPFIEDNTLYYCITVDGTECP